MEFPVAEKMAELPVSLFAMPAPLRRLGCTGDDGQDL